MAKNDKKTGTTSNTSQASSASDGYRTRKVIMRGHKLQQALRLLAQGDMSHEKIAERFGVTRRRISQINAEHRERVEEIRADIENEFAGLWVADKKNRVAEYQEDLDAINEKLATFKNLNEDAQSWIRLRDKLMRAVSEELGQIPNKMSVKSDNKHVRYTLEGVDPEDLD